jgi:putative ABC transport system permease protein
MAATLPVSGIPSAKIALELLSKLEKLPAIVAARAIQHGFAYVGNDLQDIYGIDPRTIGTATQLADAYFAGGNAAAALKPWPISLTVFLYPTKPSRIFSCARAMS